MKALKVYFQNLNKQMLFDTAISVSLAAVLASFLLVLCVPLFTLLVGVIMSCLT